MTLADDAVAVTPSLVARIGELGIGKADLERAAGVALTSPEGREVRITTAQFFGLWRAIEARVPDRDLGLRMGVESTSRGYSVASIAALHGSDLRAALAILGRYKRIMCPEQVELDAAGGETSVRFHWILAETEPPRLLVDGTFSALVSLARVGTGKPFVPRRLELARRPADEAMLTAFFGCPVTFGAPIDRLVIGTGDLSVPFVTRDASVLASLAPGLEAALVGRARTRSLRVETRLALARLMSARPSVEKVARRLAVSPRTLQRRLGEEGTTYQAELDDVRRTMARRLLANTAIDPLEVTFLLGFEEPSSFSRAFRGWEGTTPLRYRFAEPPRASRRAASVRGAAPPTRA